MKPASKKETSTQTATPEFKSWFAGSKVTDKEGNPLRVYHGSPEIEEFDEFRDEFLGKGNDQYGAGFYFTDDPYMASGYASSYPKTGGTGSKGVLPVYLKITNPIVLDNADSINHYPLTKSQSFEIMKLAPNIYDLGESPLGNMIDVWSHGGIDDALLKKVAKGYDFTISTLRNDFFPDNPKEYLKALEKITGHDGVIVNFRHNSFFVVFDGKQIKSALGNNGNFDPNSSKITDGIDQTETPEFANWFGNSRATDDDGNPLMLYHGSNSDFSEFSITKLGQAQDFGFAGAGFYFIDDPEWASAYADVGSQSGGSAVVYPVFLKMENPLELNNYDWFGGIPANAEEAIAIQDRVKKQGYDSIIIRGKPGNPSEFVVFDPNQIKSATGNNGSFSSNSGNITEDASPPRYRKPTTPEFKEWYGYSRVPKVVFHFTGADFDAFDTSRSDLGAHFGNLDQANYRANLLADSPNRSGNIIPVWLSIQNPLRLKDTGSFHADSIAPQLVTKGIIDKNYAKRITKEIESDWKVRGHYDNEVRQLIKKAGYDGIVYKNNHEGDGDSWIIFDANQAKSAIGNNGSFDPSNPSMVERFDTEPNPGPGAVVINKKNAVSSLVPQLSEDEPFSSSPKLGSASIGMETTWKQDGAYFVAKVVPDSQTGNSLVGLSVDLYRLKNNNFELLDNEVVNGIENPALDYLNSMASEIATELRSKTGLVSESVSSATVWSSLLHPVRRFWTKKQAYNHCEANKSSIQPLIALSNGVSNIVVDPDDAKLLKTIGYETINQASLTEAKLPFSGSYEHWRSLMSSVGAKIIVKGDVEVAKLKLTTVGKWYPSSPNSSWTKLPEPVVEASKYKLLRTPQPDEPLVYKITGYHATLLDHWKSISRYGLVPGKSTPSSQDWLGTWSGKAIYYHLSFPLHEIDNSYNPDTGMPFALIIETTLHHPAGYFVPDEDVSPNVDDTPDVIKSNGSIAVGYPTPSNQFIAIHLVDTEQARTWAKANVTRWPVVFHPSAV